MIALFILKTALQDFRLYTKNKIKLHIVLSVNKNSTQNHNGCI